MSLFRNLTWFVKGMKEYTKSGYEAAASKFKPEDITSENAKGKVIMITGANSGIGYEMALKLASLGATVHLVCRNQERGQKALDSIKEKCPDNKNLHLHLADMGKLSTVSGFANQFSSQNSSLDVLILNAGAMLNNFETDSELNLELNFVTNTLGTFILGEKLCPLLAKSRGSRVIVVSSGGMLVQKLKYDDPSQTEYFRAHPDKFDGTMIYAQNKRQQVVITEEWAKKYQNPTFVSMHPGWSSTPGVETAMPSFHEKMKNKLRTPAQGADTAIWLAICPKLPKDSNGAFFQDRKIVSKHLPLAGTHSSSREVDQFMTYLQTITKEYTQF